MRKHKNRIDRPSVDLPEHADFAAILSVSELLYPVRRLD